jgi:hypothetical protein
MVDRSTGIILPDAPRAALRSAVRDRGLKAVAREFQVSTATLARALAGDPQLGIQRGSAALIQAALARHGRTFLESLERLDGEPAPTPVPVAQRAI